MTAFLKMEADGTMSKVREIKQTDLARCPHVIMMTEHYQDDGTCYCHEPTATVMREWGYRWSTKQGRWI
jgi:hypothetical protein